VHTSFRQCKILYHVFVELAFAFEDKSYGINFISGYIIILLLKIFMLHSFNESTARHIMLLRLATLGGCFHS